jgi:hypothetical protein
MRFDDATRLLSALERHGVRYALIGSMAMAARGIVRATQDIDFFIDPSPENVARLRQALRSVFDDDSIEEIRSDERDTVRPQDRADAEALRKRLALRGDYASQ